MKNSFFEVNYPLSFRKEDAKRLGEYLRLRHSVELIGMRRVGISDFLRFFLFHKDIVSTYINHGEKHMFVAVDLNDLVEREIFPFWVLTFKRLVDRVESSDLSASDKKKISALFLDSIQSQDAFMTLDNLRKALVVVVSAGFLPTLFLIRFDRLEEVVSPEFFANLEGLKEATGEKLAYVFTSFRSLDEIAPEAFLRKSFSVFSHLMYLKPANDKDTRIIFETFEKKYNVLPSSAILSKLVELSGGHAQYLLLSLILLSQKKDQKVDTGNLQDLILEDERVAMQSEEIWDSLSEEECKILEKVVAGQKLSVEEGQKGKYLWETGLVGEENGKSVVFSVLFLNFLKNNNGRVVQESGEFTKKENALFEFLLSNLGQVCEREKIIEAVWPEEKELGVSDWTIDRLVARLRMKLKIQKSKYQVVTVKTRGYKLTA